MTKPVAHRFWRTSCTAAVQQVRQNGQVRLAQRAWPPVALLALAFTAWEGWVRLRDVPEYVLPPPSQVAATAVESGHLLPAPLGTTLLETGLGLLAGLVIGAGVALLVVAVPFARRSVGPLLVASQTIPMIVLAPIFALVFGIGLVPKVVVVALVTFFPVAISTIAGLDGADDELVDLVRSLDQRTSALLRVVRIPAAVPALVAGLRISSAYAVAGAVIAEGTGGDRGLGFFINRAQGSFRVDRVIVAVVVVALISAVLYGLVGVVGRLIAPWAHFAPASPLTSSVPVAPLQEVRL